MTTHHPHHEPHHEAERSATEELAPLEYTPTVASQPMTFTIQTTPKKVFFAGFIVGLIIMALPTVYFATRSSASADTSGGTIAVGTNPTPSGDQPTPAAPTPGKVKPVGKDDYVFGDKNAQLTMIEYSDLECPFCQRFDSTVSQVIDAYKGKVNWVYRHFPLSFHVNAQKEAEASECAGELGGSKKYYEYIDKIFERTTANGTGFALDSLVPLAKELKLNEGKFKTCLDSGKYASKIQQALKEGQEAGVDGTPGTILLTKDGKSALVPGAVPFEDLKAQIDSLLK